MSTAGIHSNRGDGYQRLVAFDWALTILSDPDYKWLEIDSVALPVDDVVIGKVDGSRICCQCKKNQTQHKSWSFSDLEDELIKAVQLLSADSFSLVRFYSRSAFGDVSALKEYGNSFSDEESYHRNLGQALAKTDDKLKALISSQGASLSTYQFLKRTVFEVSPELDKMEMRIRERLRYLVSNDVVAYNAIWTRLDNLGMRSNGQGENVASQHRVTKNDIKDLLEKAGSLLTPPMDSKEVRALFRSASAIGRSWRRDIGDEYISSPTTTELLSAIESKNRSILLTGAPGSGKTCVLLNVQDTLEDLAKTRTDIVPVFIQAREFADTGNEKDLQALGLPEQWVQKAARVAEDSHLVVMIDSLDVLSIAREHRALKYFLAQIDRLLLISNVTVVAACREFDCHYDRRIAQRTWGKRVICKPLEWDAEVAPLLTKLGIDFLDIDQTTRQLICNPRELALFVELAQQGVRLNVINSQALAQHYLDTIVLEDPELGDNAMHAIVSMATDMLRLRRLAIPHQLFSSSQEIKRLLLSNKVLHESQDGQLTFGHQTLLDVLVIRGALRNAETLNQFIQRMPPVPFIRPTIRSFVKQLAIGSRLEFRKQLRTVLTGDSAFHIRRLVAEVYSEQTPKDDDWLLIRDLRNSHPEVFRVIYNQGAHVEWHYFWMKHLVPLMKDTLDVEGLTIHAQRVSQWKNHDTEGVVKFWMEVIETDGVDSSRLLVLLSRLIEEIEVDSCFHCLPLLDKLLKLPKQEHSFLGHAVAHCVNNAGLGDSVLWDYIAGDVNNEDFFSFRFDKQLRCRPHEFGKSGNRFLKDRMQNSTELLELAIGTVERWSEQRQLKYEGGSLLYFNGFLRETSYNDAHSQHDYSHVDNARLLFDAIEHSVVQHAKRGSSWWESNRERLCFSSEGALRYFSILAFKERPCENVELIGCMLCDKDLLESDLAYELGELLKSAFIYLDNASQDVIQSAILGMHRDKLDDSNAREFVVKEQSQLIAAIPCYLRSPLLQAVLDECHRIVWPFERQPATRSSGGFVSAPFSFDVFIEASDIGVIRLLDHYEGFSEDSLDMLLSGGEREVGFQLQEAASRAPSRFVSLLSENYEKVSGHFREDIMQGVADFLAKKYGDLRSGNNWLPIENPDPKELVSKIIYELEVNSVFWGHGRASSKAIQGCAHSVTDPEDVSRLVDLAINFASLQEESSVSGESVDLLTTGINMSRGITADALMVIANNLLERGVPFPKELVDALRIFAVDDHPAVRALLIRRMPYFLTFSNELGWEIFDHTVSSPHPELWKMAEPCLYYLYHRDFETVSLWLDHIYQYGEGQDLEVWGRISALSVLSGHMDIFDLLKGLDRLKSENAWAGASSVWTHIENFNHHRDVCLIGLEAGLDKEERYSLVVAKEICGLFEESSPLILLPLEIVVKTFDVLVVESDSVGGDIFGFEKWLNAVSLRDPLYAMEVLEVFLGFSRRGRVSIFDHENNLAQLLTRLFEQAEEQEESDKGAMLHRVVSVQDDLLFLGVDGIHDWLKAAERP
ncbi:AAA family ATPase [Halomonas organivorans]